MKKRTFGGLRRRKLRRMVCVHEAGHAVAHLLLGYKVDSVSVIPTPTSAGRCKPARLPDGIAADAEHFTQAVVAGESAVELVYPGGGMLVAEHAHRLCPRPRRRANKPAAPAKGPSDSDLFRAAAILTDAAPMDADAKALRGLQARALAGAMDLLEPHLGAVKRVAKALLNEKVLSGERVAELVAQAA